MNAPASNQEWVKWGERDPLWAVSTEPGRQRGAPNAWTREAFQASGEADWRDFYSQWQQYGIDTRRCLEIGCGAGRITHQLSRVFQSVLGIDVSPGMIAEARINAAPNVHFQLTDGVRLPEGDSSVSAIFSTHVLQHLDSPDSILACLMDCHRVLSTNGSLMIHLQLCQWPDHGRTGPLMRLVHRMSHLVAVGLARLKRILRRPLMRFTAVPVDRVYATLLHAGFRDIEFRTFPTTRNGHLHSFVLARR